MKTPVRFLKTVSVVVLAVAAAAPFVPAARAQEALPRPAGPSRVAFRPSSAAPGDRLRALVERPEVQSHLKLTVRQKAELGLNPKPGKDGANSSSNGTRTLTLSVPTGSENASPEERQKQIEEAVAGLGDKLAAESQDRAGKIKDVLTPDQYARLLELNLQRRGALALGDPAVAEQIKLDPAKRAPVAALASEAQRKMDAAFSEALLGVDAGETGPRSAAAVAGRVEQFQRDMKNRLSPVRQKTDKIKKEAEANILALLSDEEQTRWREAQGEPFSFRKDR